MFRRNLNNDFDQMSLLGLVAVTKYSCFEEEVLVRVESFPPCRTRRVVDEVVRAEEEQDDILHGTPVQENMCKDCLTFLKGKESADQVFVLRGPGR